MLDQLKYTNKLKEARVLIIGGTSGLGFGAAQALLEQNISQLILSSSSTTRIEAAIAKLHSLYPSTSAAISGYACNLADESNLPANVENLFSQIGTLDHIIFTAGDAPLLTPFLETPFDTIKAAGMVRFFAPLLIAQHAQKHLTPGPASSITLTSGVSGEKPIPGWTVTSSYLAGLQGMMRGLALDLKPTRVNLVSPGGVDTEMWDVLDGEARQGVVAELARQTTTGRVGRVKDIAEAYLYCLRDWNLSGSVISSNGGRLLV
jgi:NAD(P)-dependent dehydrogenase (short-subunit alcohol dehydrogenase family)